MPPPEPLGGALAQDREPGVDVAPGPRERIALARLGLRDLDGLYAPVERAAARIRVPAAVVWGDRDPFFPVSVGERVARAVGGELHLLAGCGQFVPEERPEEVARAIRETVGAAAAPTSARS